MGKIELRIPGETNYLSRIRQFVLDFARQLNFDEEGIGDIEISVDEAATNIIRHAYEEDPEIPPENRIIEIEVNEVENGMEIILRDRARPYNPKNAPLPNLEQHAQEHKTHGLGVYAMKTFMDELEHQYIPGMGNQITLRKFHSKK